jgi:exosortase K
LAAIAFAMWGLKRHYATAEVGELSWILKPVASLSAIVSGARFEWEPGAGFLSRDRFFVIAKPCAGVNFMLAALGLVGWRLSQRASSWRVSASLFVLSLGIAYSAALIANTTRIAVALWLTAHPFTTDFWTPARIHRLQGITVYFGMLVALHALAQRVANRCQTIAATLPTATLPLAFYYLVTVLVPLANGSGDTRQAFLEHMAFVVLAPPTLVGVVAVLRAAFRLSIQSSRGGASLALPRVSALVTAGIGRSFYTQKAKASLQDQCIDVGRNPRRELARLE